MHTSLPFPSAVLFLLTLCAVSCLPPITQQQSTFAPDYDPSKRITVVASDADWLVQRIENHLLEAGFHVVHDHLQYGELRVGRRIVADSDSTTLTRSVYQPVFRELYAAAPTDYLMTVDAQFSGVYGHRKTLELVVQLIDPRDGILVATYYFRQNRNNLGGPRTDRVIERLVEALRQDD